MSFIVLSHSDKIWDNPGFTIDAFEYEGSACRGRFTMDIEGEMPIDIEAAINLHGGYDFIISNSQTRPFVTVQLSRKGLSNVHSLLRTNGKCLLTMFPKAAHFAAYREMALRARWAPYMKDMERVVLPYQDCEAPEETFRDLMTECGFRDVKVSCVPQVQNVGPHIDGLRSLLRQINPFIRRIPEADQEQYLSELMDTYMGCTASLHSLGADGKPAAGGPFYLTYHILEATGTK